MRNTKLKAFETVPFIKKYLELVTFQSFNIWFFKKITLKKKIFKNKLLLFNTFKS